MSSAIRLMTHDNLLDILTVSRRNNTAKQLTGMLLYGEGTFVQVLEGEPEVISQTYNIIEKDPRHRNLIVITSGELEKRNFPDWSMGFKTINHDILKEFEGFKDIRDEKFLKNSKEHPSLAVLKTFAETNNLL